MAEPVQRVATCEDLLAVPEHLVAEIMFGRAVTHPRPASEYAFAATALSGVLNAAFQSEHSSSGGWNFLREPKLHLGPHVIVPDIAAWRRERLSGLPESAWADMAPDWTCEVLSPSTERHDRYEKRTIYAHAGVGGLWFVDPRPQMLEVFELRDGKWLLLGAFRDNADVAAAPFETPSSPLGLLWPFDAPTEGPA